MNRIANVIIYSLGIGALGGSLWGAAQLLDKLLGMMPN